MAKILNFKMKNGMFKNLNRKNVCEPAMLYLFLSVVGLVMVALQNRKSFGYCVGKYECDSISKPLAFMMKFVYILFWTWLLNTLCKSGYRNISWLVVLFPFLVYFGMVMGLASRGVFHLKESYTEGQDDECLLPDGSLDPECDDEGGDDL